MKILVVMGSPRKGKTWAAVQKVQQAMQLLGPVEFDVLWLKEAKLQPCLGCHICVLRGESKCPLKEDLAEIQTRMLAADGVIFATPVYSQQVSALLKTMIDHFSYLWHRPRFFGKFSMALATGGGQFKETLGYIKQVTHAWGFTFASQLGVPHLDALTPKMSRKVEGEIIEASHRFYRMVEARRVPAPSLYDLMWFRIWRINARALKAENPTDFAYFTEKGWFEQDYYTGQPVNPLLKPFLPLLEKMVLSTLRSVYKGY